MKIFIAEKIDKPFVGLIFILNLVFFPCLSYGAKEKSEDLGHPLAAQSERLIQEKARKRNYRGGKDEESLTVQTQLPSATRKGGVVEEAPPEPAASDD